MKWLTIKIVMGPYVHKLIGWQFIKLSRFSISELAHKVLSFFDLDVLHQFSRRTFHFLFLFLNSDFFFKCSNGRRFQVSYFVWRLAFCREKRRHVIILYVLYVSMWMGKCIALYVKCLEFSYISDFFTQYNIIISINYVWKYVQIYFQFPSIYLLNLRLC